MFKKEDGGLFGVILCLGREEVGESGLAVVNT